MRQAERIGAELGPDRGARAAAEDDRLARRQPELGEAIGDIATRERESLEHRARDVATLVRCGEAVQRAARLGSPARRHQTGERRDERHAIGAGRRGRGERIERVIGRDAQQVARPAQHAAGHPAGILDEVATGRVDVRLDHRLRGVVAKRRRGERADHLGRAERRRRAGPARRYRRRAASRSRRRCRRRRACPRRCPRAARGGGPRCCTPARCAGAAPRRWRTRRAARRTIRRRRDRRASSSMRAPDRSRPRR